MEVVSPIRGRLGHAKAYAELEGDEQVPGQTQNETDSKTKNRQRTGSRAWTDRRDIDQKVELTREELGGISG